MSCLCQLTQWHRSDSNKLHDQLPYPIIVYGNSFSGYQNECLGFSKQGDPLTQSLCWSIYPDCSNSFTFLQCKLRTTWHFIWLMTVYQSTARNDAVSAVLHNNLSSICLLKNHSLCCKIITCSPATPVASVYLCFCESSSEFPAVPLTPVVL